jgi:hypothetical protein
VIFAFLRVEQVADAADGPDRFGAQERFEFCERHFDRFEIGTVGRQE